MDELRSKVDNPRKLQESRAVHRHLFVWVNDDTEWSIGRPVLNAALPGQNDGWRLPDVVPDIDSAITHLWVVHTRSLRGWLWNGEVWSVVVQSTRDVGGEG
jgi:hypothetical protein